MQLLEVSNAVRPIYGSLGFKGLKRANGLRMFDVCVLRKIYGHQKEEVA